MSETPLILERFRWLRRLSGVHHFEARTNISAGGILQRRVQKEIRRCKLARSAVILQRKREERGRKPGGLNV